MAAALAFVIGAAVEAVNGTGAGVRSCLVGGVCQISYGNFRMGVQRRIPNVPCVETLSAASALLFPSRFKFYLTLQDDGVHTYDEVILLLFIKVETYIPRIRKHLIQVMENSRQI